MLQRHVGFRSLSFWVRWVLPAAAFLFVSAAGVLVFYHIRFGRMIEGRLNGQQLNNTPYFFAAPRRIFLGQNLLPGALETYLRQAGYSEVPQLGATGQFIPFDSSIEIRPSADSYFGRSNALSVRFSGPVISTIRSLDSGEELSNADLEPIPLTNLFNDDTREKQRPVHFSDLPPILVQTVLSSEDNRFFQHHGVDLVRVFGAAWINIRRHTKVQGASTITMQTARSFFFSPQRTWRRKFEETLMALELERRFTKQQIFELYANQVYLGNHGSFAIHGFGEAAHAYFDKDVRDLTLGEAAFLAGIIRSPNRYSSQDCTPELASEARDRVLAQMVRRRVVTSEAARQAMQPPMHCAEDAPESNVAPYFLDMVRAQLLNRYSESELLSKRYRIYTTLDSELERAAVQAVEDKINGVDLLLASRAGASQEDQHLPQAQVALVALNPRTGAIEALVGGRNYGRSQLNRALAWRQPGSVFKPFVYAAAFSNAVDGLTPVVTPATTVVDKPTTFSSEGKRYTPNNYRSEYHGTVTLRDALVESMNVPAVKLAEMVGYERVVQFARQLRLGDNIRPTPLAAMGVYEMTPLDVAAAYTIFANAGARAEPWLIDRVVGPDGSTSEENSPNVHQVLDKRVAYMVTSILEDVVNRGTGAGVRRQGLTGAAAGKTGTSGDGWFAGFTPDLLCVVWVGFDDDHDLKLTGAQSAVPVWTEFMGRASLLMQYRSVESFSPPEGVKVVAIDPETHQLATTLCPIARDEAFLAGTEPTHLCGHHTDRMMVLVPVASWVSRHYDHNPDFCDPQQACGFGIR